MSAQLPAPSQVSEVQSLHDIDAVDTPAQDTRSAWDGSAVTSGLAQYEEEGHFAVFDNSDAAKLYQGFLSTAMDGLPEIPER